MRACRTLSLLFALSLIAIGCGDSGNIGGDDDDDDNGNGDGGPDNCNELDCPDAGPSSCKLIDLVISVDPSGSMTEELVAMRTDVFPAFATRLGQIGMGLDNFRVGTIDACPDPATYHTNDNGGTPCNFSSGEVWIDSSSPDLNAEFTCVGDIDKASNCSGDNDDEQPASAAAASLEPPYSTGANAGFSRSDALLVVIAITDEDEQPTPNQNSGEVYNRLVATKGDVKRMVFLGIGGGSNCSGVYGTADQAVKLREITDLFIAQNRGVWWDLCVGRLEDGLDEAFQVIEQACDELPPIL